MVAKFINLFNLFNGFPSFSDGRLLGTVIGSISNLLGNILKDPTGVFGFGGMECPKLKTWILLHFEHIFVLLNTET